MSEEEEDDPQQQAELTSKQKQDIAKWFLTNSPPGEIHYIAKDIRSILSDEDAYNAAVSEAYPLYNKSHMICLELPNRTGDVLITTFGEIDEIEYLDPRTCQVATVNHVNQVCTNVRPATDEELPTSYIEEFRYAEAYRPLVARVQLVFFLKSMNGGALDAELVKYVAETYPKGSCSVYCICGKDVEGPGSNFELVAVISAVRHSPQNFCNGSWRSIWNIEFKDDLQVVELRGKLQVDAHYFEEGNVQLDANHECKDNTIFQSPEDCAVSIASMICHQENEYMASLEASYTNLPDTTFKDLRRKLPVTRTLFPWHNTLQFSLTKDIAKELGI